MDIISYKQKHITIINKFNCISNYTTKIFIQFDGAVNYTTKRYDNVKFCGTIIMPKNIISNSVTDVAYVDGYFFNDFLCLKMCPNSIKHVYTRQLYFKHMNYTKKYIYVIPQHNKYNGNLKNYNPESSNCNWKSVLPIKHFVLHNIFIHSHHAHLNKISNVNNSKKNIFLLENTPNIAVYCIVAQKNMHSLKNIKNIILHGEVTKSNLYLFKNIEHLTIYHFNITQIYLSNINILTVDNRIKSVQQKLINMFVTSMKNIKKIEYFDNNNIRFEFFKLKISKIFIQYLKYICLVNFYYCNHDGTTKMKISV